MRMLVLALALLPLFACDDASTQPNDDLDGSWHFTFTEAWARYYDSEIPCAVTSVDFTITRSGDTFSAAQVGSGRIMCNLDGWVVVDELVTGETMVEGRISGNEITFRLRALSGQMTGWISRNAPMLFGSAEWGVAAGETVVWVNAKFTAVRP